jgi:hypothetical protein
MLLLESLKGLLAKIEPHFLNELGEAATKIIHSLPGG